MTDVKAPPQITSQMVRTAARACKAHSAARAQAEALEKTKKTAMMELFQPLLGIKSEEELSGMSPEDLRATIRRRLREEKITLAEDLTADALIDAIEKSQSRRQVQWKEQLIAELGEAKALAIAAAAAESFSYRVKEPTCLA